MAVEKMQKLKAKLFESRLTYDDCAKLLGVSTNTFNSKINGKTRFYVDEASLLSELANLTNEEAIDIFLS